VVFDNKVKKTWKPNELSDLLTYWRHEFFTYKAAHGPGGSHVVERGCRGRLWYVPSGWKPFAYHRASVSRSIR
jgi:hypothetical protein